MVCTNLKNEANRTSTLSCFRVAEAKYP